MAELRGTGGDDVIALGEGVRATGGGGADRFVAVGSADWLARGVSVVTDFNSAEGDRLDLGAWPVTPVVFRGALDNAGFGLKLGAVFSPGRDYGGDLRQVWTWATGGGLYVILDTDGSRTLSVEDIVVRLDGVTALTAGAFVEGAFRAPIAATRFGTDAADVQDVADAGIYYGLAGDDVIHGSAGRDEIHGGPGQDRIWGGAASDKLYGGDGDDWIDGGDGLDAAFYFGDLSDYAIDRGLDGALHVRDLRGTDGADTLLNIERLQFADRYVAVSYVAQTEVETAFKAILRAPSDSPSQLSAAITISDVVTQGAPSTQINPQIIKVAVATTSVATLAYQFFTGRTPSEAGVDYLVAPGGPNVNNLNSAYYQAFSIENRYINFAVNLGKLGEGKEAFAAKYGTISLFDATREAYKTIFGAAPTDAKIHALIDTRADYFAAYGGDGANGVGTKAAMVGWLLAEAAKADIGVMAKSNDAWLMDLADGAAPFAIDILDPAKGYWKADFVFGGA